MQCFDRGKLRDEIDIQRQANGCLAIVVSLPDPDLAQQLMGWTLQKLQAAYAAGEAGFNLEGVQNPTTGEDFVTITAASPVAVLEGVTSFPLSEVDVKAIASKSLSHRDSPYWSALHTLTVADSGNLSVFFPPGMEWPKPEEVVAGSGSMDAITDVPVWCTHPDCMRQGGGQRRFENLAAAREHFELHRVSELLAERLAKNALSLAQVNPVPGSIDGDGAGGSDDDGPMSIQPAIASPPVPVAALYAEVNLGLFWREHGGGKGGGGGSAAASLTGREMVYGDVNHDGDGAGARQSQLQYVCKPPPSWKTFSRHRCLKCYDRI